MEIMQLLFILFSPRIGIKAVMLLYSIIFFTFKVTTK